MNTGKLHDLLWNTFGNLSDEQLMALVIYGEARGESRQGKIAVGTVILERVDHRDWDGKTIQEVCLMPYQFSCLLPDDPNFKTLSKIVKEWNNRLSKDKSLQECFEIASGLIKGVISRDFLLSSHNCTQYKTVNCAAAWTSKMRLLIKIGNHEFYI